MLLISVMVFLLEPSMNSQSVVSGGVKVIPPRVASWLHPQEPEGKLGYEEMRNLIPAFKTCLWDTWVLVS